jgi:hypothetical protein
MGPPLSSLDCIFSIKQPFLNFGRTISKNAAISTMAAAGTDAETERDHATSMRAMAPRPAESFFQNEPNWDNSNNLSTLKPGSAP